MGVVGGGLIITGMGKNHDCLMGFEARWKQHSFMSRTMSYGSSTPEKKTIIAYLRNDALVLGKSMRWMLATTPSTICFFRKQCGVTWIFCELSLSKRSEFR